MIGVPVLISETGETSKLQPTHTTPEQPPAFTNRFAPPARRIELTELIYLAGIPPVSAWKRRLAIGGDIQFQQLRRNDRGARNRSRDALG